MHTKSHTLNIPLKYMLLRECYVVPPLMRTQLHAFFISNTFISNFTVRLAKNQAKAKHHSEVELLLFENYSLSSSMLSSKTNMRYSKRFAKSKCVSLHKKWSFQLRISSVNVWIWSRLLKKFLMKNYNFCAVSDLLRLCVINYPSDCNRNCTVSVITL